MHKIVFATKNKGKMKEIIKIMEGMEIELFSMKEIGLDIDVLEDGTTFEENAVKKSVEIMKACNEITIADDSGLEIDYLNKEPGVYSARYLGEDTSYEYKNKVILDRLKDVPNEKRTARFVSVASAAFPDGKVISAKGIIEGIISDVPKGENGFGYDPIFYVPEYGMTTAEMSIEEKNKISHRGKAFELLKLKLKDILED